MKKVRGSFSLRSSSRKLARYPQANAHTFGVMFVCCCLALCSSCSDDKCQEWTEIRMGLNIEVTPQGWNDSITRASYASATFSGAKGTFATTFQEGDTIGLFVVDKTGRVVVANHPFTYSGSAWTTDTPIEYVTGMRDYTFFAYYPWVSSLTDAPALNSMPDLTSATTFFEDAIEAWTPAADQSTMEKFTGSDLMVAKGTATMSYFQEVNVSFTMAHQMGLFITEPDMTFYDIHDPSDTWTVTQTFTTNIPYELSGKYYYLVKPDTETTLGAKKATLSTGQVEQLYFTNNEPGEVEYHDHAKTIKLGSVHLGTGSITYSYSTSTDQGTSWSNFTSIQPAWLTLTPEWVDGEPVSLSATCTSTKTTSIVTETYSNEPLFINEHDAVLKAAPPVHDVDLSMVHNDGTPRAARSTANCYLVHAPGTYKVPLVYGNAIKNGNTNTLAYLSNTASNSYKLQNLVNHADENITDPWLKNHGAAPDGAALVWQDVNGLIASVDIDGDFLTFTVDENNIAEGNAVIAATMGGSVVWSWHIWVTPETLANTTLISTGSHDYTVAPVNVGQVNTILATGTVYAGSKCRVRATMNGMTIEFEVTQPDYNDWTSVIPYPSPYYQWGRKDAMMPAIGAYDEMGASCPAYSIPNGTLVSSTTTTIGSTIQNPQIWYINSTNSGPFGAGTNAGKRNYWDINQIGVDNVTTPTIKTVYDPCPPDFCVPTGNLYYYRSEDPIYYTYSRPMETWDDTRMGGIWTMNITGDELFFPATGLRGDGNGYPSYLGSVGYYWSASALDNVRYGHCLNFDSSIWRWHQFGRSGGLPIRPVVEE